MSSRWRSGLSNKLRIYRPAFQQRRIAILSSNHRAVVKIDRRAITSQVERESTRCAESKNTQSGWSPSHPSDGSSALREPARARDQKQHGHSEGSPPRPKGRSPYVPFERAPDALSSVLADAMTLTQNERRTFRQIRAATASKPTKEDQQPQRRTWRRHRPNESQLDSILDGAMKDIMAQVVDRGTQSSRPASKSCSKPRAARRSLQSQTVLDRAKVEQSITEATTDFEIWHVLERDIFGPVIALDLDKVTQINAPSSNRGGKGFKLTGLASDFGPLLTMTARSLSERFPASPLIMSIIPKLHKAGPSTYALGVSTQLYNHVLGHALRHLEDAKGAVDILEEMDRVVIEPDSATWTTVKNAKLMIDDCLDGKYGYFARMCQISTQMTKAAKYVKTWLGKHEKSAWQRSKERRQ